MNLNRMQLPTTSRTTSHARTSRCATRHTVQQSQRLSIVTPSWKPSHTSNAEVTQLHQQQETELLSDISIAPVITAAAPSTAGLQLASQALTGGHRESLLLSYAVAGVAGAFGEHDTSLETCIICTGSSLLSSSHGPCVRYV